MTSRTGLGRIRVGGAGAPSAAGSADAGRDAATQRADVVRFWRAVEVFTPSAVKPVDHGRGRSDSRPGEGVYRVFPRQPLPWQPGHRLGRERLDPGKTWQHLVYGGVFGLDLLYERMEAAFGPSDADLDERVPRGDTALFTLVVDAQGQGDLNSLVLSSAAWGLGRAGSPGPSDRRWLDGFDDDVEELRDKLRAALAEAETEAEADTTAAVGESIPNGGPAGQVTTPPDGAEPDAAAPEAAASSATEPAARPLDESDLRRVVALTAQFLGLSGLSSDWEIRVVSRQVPLRRQDEPGRVEDAFLNSFHVDDLDRVAKAITAGRCGRALTTLLTEDPDLDVDARIDVRSRQGRPVVRAALSPARVPAGRWPAKSTHPLAASQQLAVGEVVARLSQGSGVFAVNGPPGTGKTTMLRDLIAAVVVGRAQRLAALARPAAAFTETLTWNVDGRAQKVQALDPALTGFEMVIASENNGAVENISREIPSVSAIDESWREEADYFGEHATRLLGEPAWGLVSAALGNMANRHRFVKQFWFGDQEARHRDRGTTPGDKGPEEGRSPGFRDHLWALARVPVDWDARVAEFRTAVDAAERLRTQREGLQRLLAEHPATQAALPRAQAALVEAGRTHQAAEDSMASTARTAVTAAAREQQARERRAEHRQAKPGIIEMLLTGGKAARRWNSEDESLAAAVLEAQRQSQEAHKVAERAAAASKSAADDVLAAERAVADAARHLDEADRRIRQAAQAWGNAFPDEQWWDDPRRRELSGPWLDEAWNEARSRVFLAALDLHRAFITATAATLARNLDTTRRILQGQAPRDLPEPVARAAWHSLFLVVPVVSTTFASVPRLFSHLGEESLGWLFVDEAGQARPQSAVGAVWRARRVVAVGDPMQLEPVVTVLNTTQQALRRHHGVSSLWLPAATCLQTLADRVTPVGTLLPAPGGEPVWVGSPLRVHRRCDEPMFSLVNVLVYDGMMVHATPPREHPLAAEPTRWVDVSGSGDGGNWVPQEGEAAAQILEYLLGEKGLGLAPKQVFVISPFRQVVAGLKHRLRGYEGVSVSTVHRTQGQERDVVVLVLGSDPARPGARAWAAQKPNLLNVAVSRAKQRLYVVGDHALWSQQPYFDLLAGRLDHRPFSPRQG